MPYALARIQDALSSAAPELEGWLIYDFRSSNPHAAQLLELGQAFLTRRYFVWVPRTGRPTLLHHRIEGGTWQRLLSGQEVAFEPYSAHSELDAALRQLVGGKTIAMEYSELGAVPYVSTVDAGTLERVRQAGAQVRSSADLLQGFQAWTPEDLAAHRRAVAVLMLAKDKAFEYVHDGLQRGQAVTELDVQAIIGREIASAGMVSGHPVNVSFGANAADPHYEPSPGAQGSQQEVNATLRAGECVLIDLWAQEVGRPFADVTWVGHAGQPGEEYWRAWRAVAAARDTALGLLQERGGWQGYQLDRAARQVIAEAGFGAAFTHRLGHSLGVQIHGAGANLDDLETHDTRALLPQLAVTLEPGVYLSGRYGIRSEINVLITAQGAALTTPVQAEPFILGGQEHWEEVRQRALSAVPTARVNP